MTPEIQNNIPPTSDSALVSASGSTRFVAECHYTQTAPAYAQDANGISWTRNKAVGSSVPKQSGGDGCRCGAGYEQQGCGSSVERSA